MAAESFTYPEETMDIMATALAGVESTRARESE